MAITLEYMTAGVSITNTESESVIYNSSYTVYGRSHYTKITG